MLRFTRTISIKRHPTGDHYSLSIPSQVAQALGLHDGGGLVSIEILDKSGSNKKAVSLKAYRDSDFAWREHFDPAGMRFKPVAIPPRTLGPSRPWATGKVFDFKADLRDLRVAIVWMEAEFRRTFPPRRGRRRRRRR